jgi:hypothetical protein
VRLSHIKKEGGGGGQKVVKCPGFGGKLWTRLVSTLSEWMEPSKRKGKDDGTCQPKKTEGKK